MVQTVTNQKQGRRKTPGWMVFGGFMPLVVLGVLTLSGAAQAQQVPGMENVHVWRRTSNTLWTADTLYVGGFFLRDATKPFIVWLRGNVADATGRLHLMVGDSAYPLFTNKQTGARVDLTNIPYIRNNIRNLDTVTFMYQVVDKGGLQDGVVSTNRRYTGRNRGPGDGFQAIDRYYSVDKTGETLFSPNGTTFTIGRRWSVAGMMQRGSVVTDSVEFGFEDLVPGWNIYDYDDIVFGLYGVYLLSPPDSISLSISGNNIPAGDSVRISSTLFNESGQPIKLDSAIYNNIVWSFVGTADPNDRIISPVPGRTNKQQAIVTGTRAHRCVTVRANYTDPTTRRNLTSTVEVCIEPGPAHSVVIERDSTPDLWTPRPRDTVMIAANQNNAVAFAFLRDRFNNLLKLNGGKATRAGWTLQPPPIVTVRGRTGNEWIGDFTRASDGGMTTVIASQAGVPVSDTALVILMSQGPEITRALFYLGTPPGTSRPVGSATPYDTIKVTFTVPVRCEDLRDPLATFNLVGVAAGLSNRIRFGDETRTCNGLVTEATILVDSGLVRPMLDSIQIKSLRDQHGGERRNGQVKVIEWGRSYDLFVNVVANPFKVGPEGTNIREVIGGLIDEGAIPIKTGTAIKVDLASLQRIDVPQSYMILYDAVGNQITDQIPVVPGRTGTSFFFFWDGRNRNNRLVGSGTYLAIVRIRIADTGEIKTTRAKIGLRR